MFLDDVRPVLELIANWEATGYKRDRAGASPVAEAALTLWNLGRWLEEHHPDAFELPNGSFVALLASIHAEVWGNVEAVAASDADRLMTDAGTAQSNDVVISSIACVLATINSANAGRVPLAWTYAIDARHLAIMILHGWNMRQNVKHTLAIEHAELRHARDPKGAAMAAIRAEYDRWQAGATHYAGDFATKMHAKHSAVIRNEGSIKNAVTRWRKGKK